MKTKIADEKLRKKRARRTRTIRSVAQSDRVRLTVNRTSKHIYAQLVSPETGQTLASVSSQTQGVVDGYTGNVEAARRVGTALAEIAKEKNIQEVVFNRNGFLYHGRVRALAEAAREAGLRF